MKLRTVFLLMIFILLLLPVHQSLSSVTSQSRTDLIIGTIAQPQDLNPWGIPFQEKIDVLALLDMGLTYLDVHGNLNPGLTTELPTTVNGRIELFEDEEGRITQQVVHWTLRPDAYWSDGNPITCEDAEFTFAVQQREDLRVDFGVWLPFFSDRTVVAEFVDSVACDPRDSKSFSITYNRPYTFHSTMFGRIGLAGLFDLAPKHIWEPVVEDATSGQDLIASAPSQGIEIDLVVGSGPFALTAWEKDKQMVLTRRDDFFLVDAAANPQLVQSIVIKFFPDLASLTAAIQDGSVDAVDQPSLRSFSNAELQDLVDEEWQIIRAPGTFIEQLHFNLFEDPAGVAGLFPDQVDCPAARQLLLADRRTREAIMLALDRRALVDTVLPGTNVANSFIISGDTGFTDDVVAWEQDLSRANQLLAELGWVDLDGDGFLERTASDGAEIQFDLNWISTPRRELAAEILKQQLADVGINLVIEFMPGAAFFDDALQLHGSECAWHGVLQYASGGGLGYAPANTLSSELFGQDLRQEQPSQSLSNIPLPSNGFIGLNGKGWLNTEFDSLRATAMTTTDIDTRLEALRQMQVIFNRELPSIPLYEQQLHVIHKIGLLNFGHPLPSATTHFARAWQWSWDMASESD